MMTGMATPTVLDREEYVEQAYLFRLRLGYERGLLSMAGDPFYDADWKAYIDLVRLQAGTIDFADLVYVRSHWYVMEKRRGEPGYEPRVPALFGEKEGKIAKASI